MSDLKAPAPQTRKLSTTQIVLIGLAVLLVAFLIIGSLIRPDTSNQLVFGVQQQPFATLAVLSFMLGLATTFSLLGATGFALGRVLGQNQGFIMLIGGAAIVIFGVMSLLGRGFTGATGLTSQTRS